MFFFSMFACTFDICIKLLLTYIIIGTSQIEDYESAELKWTKFWTCVRELEANACVIERLKTNTAVDSEGGGSGVL